MDLLTAARFEAIGMAAVTNALIACWDAKYTYMFWRPITAIRAGDTMATPGPNRIRTGGGEVPFQNSIGVHRSDKAQQFVAEI